MLPFIVGRKLTYSRTQPSLKKSLSSRGSREERARQIQTSLPQPKNGWFGPNEDQDDDDDVDNDAKSDMENELGECVLKMARKQDL